MEKIGDFIVDILGGMMAYHKPILIVLSIIIVLSVIMCLK